MKVPAVKCPECKDIVFSRARHDCRSCSCGKVYIDGGFGEYLRVGGSSKIIQINVKQTKKDLYDDWNEGHDKYGIINECNKTDGNSPKKS